MPRLRAWVSGWLLVLGDGCIQSALTECVLRRACCAQPRPVASVVSLRRGYGCPQVPPLCGREVIGRQCACSGLQYGRLSSLGGRCTVGAPSGRPPLSNASGDLLCALFDVAGDFRSFQTWRFWVGSCMHLCPLLFWSALGVLPSTYVRNYLGSGCFRLCTFCLCGPQCLLVQFA